MQIFVKTHSGTIALDVESGDTIGRAKAKFQVCRAHSRLFLQSLIFATWICLLFPITLRKSEIATSSSMVAIRREAISGFVFLIVKFLLAEGVA